MTATARPNGRMWQRIRATVIARDYGFCHICGCPGARQVDHIVPQTEDGGSGYAAWTLENMKLAHGGGRRNNPCPDCSAARRKPVYCNQIRGAMSVERARRVIAAQITSAGGTIPACLARLLGQPAPVRHPGRPW